jgi:peptide/nickel transport system substrate-binding protein
VASATAGCTKVAPSNPLDQSANHRHPYTIPHTLRIGDATEYASLNPHLDINSWRLADLTMAWLLRSGADDRPRPELALEVPSRANGGVSRDGRTIVYHLRHGARWSDGAPFTARDVIFSTRVAMDPRTNEQARSYFANISNVTSPNRYTVVVHLLRPYAGILYNYFFSVGTPCILPAHILARLPNINSAPYNSLPVGIGPFKYVSWDRGNRIVLAANPFYFRGRSRLDRIVITSLPSVVAVYGALRSHVIDLAKWHPWQSGGLGNDREFSTLVERFFEINYLTFNVRRPPFDELGVRQAVRLAVDRRRILQVLTEGNVALFDALTDSPYPTDHPMYSKMPLVHFDPGRANRILDAAGWRLGPDGVRTKNGRRLEIFIPSFAGSRVVDEVDELLRSDLHNIGAVAETHNYADSFLMGPSGPVARGNFDLLLSTFELDAFGDLSVQFGCAQLPPRGWNAGGYCDRSLEPLLSAFGAAYDEPVRHKIAARIAKKLFDDVPILYLRAGGEYWIFNTDLHGFAPNRTSFYDNFMKTDI